MLSTPSLPAGFYDTPALTHVRRAAEANLVAPDALLAAVLGRVATGTPPEATVNRSPLNYIAAIVGGSGAGKSQAVRTARQLLPNIGTDLDNLPVSSGEGLVQAYMSREDGENRQRHTAGLFYVDEGETLLRVAGREGSTTLATLRTLWSGESTGSTGAQSTTTRRLAADAYRFALVVGIQPAYAMSLLDDDHAGTPQRFLWVSAAHPDAPSDTPEWPGEITVTYPTTAIRLPADVIAQVNEQRRAALRQGGYSDAYQSHATQLALRLSGLLAIIEGHPTQISADDWKRGQIIVEHSRRVIQSLIDARQSEKIAEETERDLHEIDRRLNRRDAEHEANLDRIAKRAGLLLREHGELPKGQLRHRLNSRDRQHAEDAFRRGVKNGQIVLAENGRLAAGPLA